MTQIDPERFERVAELFRDALELPAAQRADFLREGCDGDTDVMREVESLRSRFVRPT